MYHINIEEGAIVNGCNGEIIRPDCFQVLAQYYSYLLNQGEIGLASDLLRDVFNGKMVISNMIEDFRRHDGI